MDTVGLVAMDEIAPNLVISGKSQSVLVDNHRFEINIHKMERDSSWTLEVVDYKGKSHVWDDQFASDADALSAAVKVFADEGAAGFLDQGNVIPFPKR